MFCYVCLQLFTLCPDGFIRTYIFTARVHYIRENDLLHPPTTTDNLLHPPTHLCVLAYLRRTPEPAGRPTPRSEAGAVRWTIQKKRGFSR